VSDADLEALVATALPDAAQQRSHWALEDLQVGCGTMGMPTASVRLRSKAGESKVAAAVGTGPVDAAYRAIDSVVQQPARLLDYNVRGVTEGIDALAEVTVRVAGGGGGPVNPQHESSDEPIWRGSGADTDIIVASVKAYLAALNRMLAAVAVAVPGVEAGPPAVHVEVEQPVVREGARG
jgi:2-isopropylmalate synthase